jgi:putative endonuclease
MTAAEIKKEPRSCYWVYIIHCRNNTYYTGYTTDVLRRYQEHLSGSAKCKYTRSFKPLKLAQCWQVFGDKTVALKMESFIKKMPKTKKIALILNPQILEKHFTCKASSQI